MIFFIFVFSSCVSFYFFVLFAFNLISKAVRRITIVGMERLKREYALLKYYEANRLTSPFCSFCARNFNIKKLSRKIFYTQKIYNLFFFSFFFQFLLYAFYVYLRHSIHRKEIWFFCALEKIFGCCFLFFIHLYLLEVRVNNRII